MFRRNNSRCSLLALLLLGFAVFASYRPAIGQMADNSRSLYPTSITSMTPKERPVGTEVIISGTGFRASQGSSTVSFNGVLATPTRWSNTEIVVPVPQGASTGPVKLCIAGKCGSAGTFTVTPSITSVSPPEGPLGAEVRIIGTAFGSSQNTSTVTFKWCACDANQLEYDGDFGTRPCWSDDGTASCNSWRLAQQRNHVHSDKLKSCLEERVQNHLHCPLRTCIRGQRRLTVDACQSPIPIPCATDAA